MVVDIYKLFPQLHLPNLEWYGLRWCRERQLQLHMVNGTLEEKRWQNSEGFFAEVLVNGHFVYVAGSHCSRQAILEAFERAYSLALQCSSFQLSRFSPSERPFASSLTERTWNVQGTPSACQGNEFFTSGPTLPEVMDWMKRADSGLNQGNAVLRRGVSVQKIHADTILVSSHSAPREQQTLITSVGLDVMVQGSQGIGQRRCQAGSHKAGQRELSHWMNSQSDLLMESLREEAIELSHAPLAPTEVCDLLISPDQMALQIHESIGHPLELDRILGDERNYAGSSFVKASDVGHLQYGSSLLNVSFDPTMPGEMATYLWDDVGALAEKKYLIQDGKLVGILGGVESQKRTGLGGVSCQRSCSWNRPSLDRMANLNIEPGASPFEEMVSGIEKGLFVKTNRSWSIDDYRNKFQFGCEYGRLIEKGKWGKVVRNPNYRGQTQDFWHQLSAVGDSQSWQMHGVLNCGKAEPNQTIRVGHASPVCLFKNVQVFGGV